jgi:DNA-binding NarL/FixJ family response regulator
MTYKPPLDEQERTEPAKVYVWTQDALAADGLRQALDGESSSEEEARVVCVSDLAEADVLLWDAGSMSLDAPAVLAQLKAAQASGQSIVALVPDAESAALCAQLGARAALRRRIHAPSLTAAILAARAGLCVFDSAFAESWLPGPSSLALASDARDVPEAQLSSTRAVGAVSALTVREQEVLQLLSLGLSNGHIAKRLSVSIHTVKFHVNSILSKLNVGTRTAAVSAAIRTGLVTL